MENKMKNTNLENVIQLSHYKAEKKKLAAKKTYQDFLSELSNNHLFHEARSYMQMIQEGPMVNEQIHKAGFILKELSHRIARNNRQGEQLIISLQNEIDKKLKGIVQEL